MLNALLLPDPSLKVRCCCDRGDHSNLQLTRHLVTLQHTYLKEPSCLTLELGSSKDKNLAITA